MNKDFGEDLQMNALRTLHAICRVPGFKQIFEEEHKFPAATFDTYVKEIIHMFTESLKPGSENWQTFINANGSIVAFCSAFPERACEFESIVKPLISVVKEKTE